MMKHLLIKISIATVWIFGLAFSCDKNPEQASGTGMDLLLTDQEKQQLEKSNRFAIDFFVQSARSLPDKDNLFVSPLSVSAAMAMTYLGANGATREEMGKTLGFDGIEDEAVKGYFKKLIEDLPRLDPQTKLAIANSIWYREDVRILESFLRTNRDYFHAETNALDFRNAASADRINTWVKDKTQGLIPDIIDKIGEDDIMYLVNAIYFKGIWKERFDLEYTSKGSFRKADGNVVEADFMENQHDYHFWSNADFDAVELPYTNDKYSMVLFRPKSGSMSGSEIVKKLGEIPFLMSTVNEDMRSNKVRLRLPKFKFAYENTINDELSALGMQLPFTNAADFTRINEAGRMKIDKVKHKAFVEVNEEGTEAAAATSVGIVVTSLPMVHEITFDCPFAFVIQEKSSGLLVFMGAVNDPLVTETNAD